jgi:hypothetical protein
MSPLSFLLPATISCRRIAEAIVLALSLVSAPGWAQWSGWDYEFDREITSWKELQAQIPPYPRGEGLLQFDVGGSGHRYFIDPKSVSVGQDGVIRYTLVIRTMGGASNISFEGIRCSTQEQKYYAIGRPDGTWSRARDPQWKRIEPREVTRQHYVLHVDFFCNGKIPVENSQRIVELLIRPELKRRGTEGG